ncbi:undecaprenyl-phosphate glucose phosphotransferase [Pontibacter sp. SGAir0037]|uniref:undecaprenyl-phosphate glucose phosphotransferase n=1 Tax=Pontibacter sp. SGAir0037 TaxID=2571030 RepID=UPI0010CCEBFE|nr:undecaprenyl-phosphate glucose phosphotransferase [Pontibacter sp. SGAir0037]QCR20992.1 undecaprenyl-phosphate glucose phosphotransferase [Pontibacter sp. SGAir0037]
MTYKYSTFFRWVNVAIDFILLNVSLYTCFLIENPDLLWKNVNEKYALNFVLLNLIWFYFSSINKLYENIFKRDSIPTIRTTIVSLALFAIGSVTLKIVLPQFNLSTVFLTYAITLFAGLVLSWKIVFLLFRRPRRRSLIKYKKLVIAGAGPVGRDLYNHVKDNTQLGYEVVGFFDDDLSLKEEGLPILGKVEDCVAYAKANNIDSIYCALPDSALAKIRKLMKDADKSLIRFRLVPDVRDHFKKNFMVEMYGHLPVLTPRNEPLEDKANQVIKRAFDIFFSVFVIVFLLSWLIPIIAIIIKLDSKGPVFFKQLRSGKDNKPFHCLKFRSMTVNKDSDSKQASKGDARITKVGAFIRKTSIDELPQFFNVLMGDMSVVGPRPHMLKHTQDYSQLIDNFMVRHFLTPGITGWAQVNGYRGETKETDSMDKRVEYDIWYLENWSLLLDLKIIFLTVWQAITGDENAF